MTMVDAIRSALRQEMERDPSVMLMGEDVGHLLLELLLVNGWGPVQRIRNL